MRKIPLIVISVVLVASLTMNTTAQGGELERLKRGGELVNDCLTDPFQHPPNREFYVGATLAKIGAVPGGLVKESGIFLLNGKEQVPPMAPIGAVLYGAGSLLCAAGEIGLGTVGVAADFAYLIPFELGKILWESTKKQIPKASATPR